MANLVREQGGVLFVGTVDADADVAIATRLAVDCGAYRPDDEDEDPLAGARTCFGCRFRRWVSDGFTCVRGLLPAALPAAG